jgi:serine/threonine-protein kinase
VPDPASQLERLTSALASRYRIERELGHGGMATVYLAEDLKHHRKVALKVLRPELAAILGAERFLKEIEVTANLQHPQILPLHDSGEADSFLYFVMPYAEGESLRDKLRRERQLAIEESVAIATAVASALDYAHRHGVIHRDIKPENILLHETQPVVADFGIALAVTAAGGTRLTETGLSLGTPEYMSPEQATGDRELDARSDVYSLGAVVYEMLTGDPPHSGNTIQAILAKVLSEEPTPITRTRKLVPANVEAAVQRALAKIPAERRGYVTAGKGLSVLLSCRPLADNPITTETYTYTTPGAGARPHRPVA